MKQPSRPCGQCPWVVTTPPGQFPQERYDALRRTTGKPGAEAPLGSPMFACHKAPEGEEFVCAGWLAAVGYEHLGVRVLLSQGQLDPAGLSVKPDWPELHRNYEEMVAAKVVATSHACDSRAVGESRG